MESVRQALSFPGSSQQASRTLTFQPFAVQCTTCASRLRVTDPAIVGTIASCPKCNSMVQITAPPAQAPPPQQVAVGAAQVDSEAITEEAIAADQSSLDPAHAPQGFVSDETVPPQPTDDLLGAPMPPQWQSQKTARSRQIGLVVALAGSGLLAALLLFGWFVKNWSSGNTAQVDPQANVDTGDPPNEETDLAAESSGDETADIRETDSADTVSEQTNTAAVDSTSPESTPVEASETPPADEIRAMDSTGTDETKPQQPSVPTPIAIDDKTPATSDDKMGIPTDLLPGFPNLGVGDAPAEGDEKANDADSAPTELPAEVKDMIGLMNLGGDKQDPQVEAPKTLEQVEIDGPKDETVDPMLVASAPPPINFTSAMAIKFSLDSPQPYPLNDLLLWVSQASGVPIQVDWVAFDIAGRDIKDGIRLDGKERNVGEHLSHIAQTIGASIKREEDRVVIAPSDELFQAKLKRILDLTDFGDGQVTALKTMNTFLVGANNPGANAKVLHLSEDSDKRKLTALAVESLRRMRSVNPKLPDGVVTRWAQPLSGDNLDWPLVTGGKSGGQIHTAIAMSGLLRRLARNNGATCFVNWDDAIRRRMSPKQLVMPYMNRDVGKILASTLQPFEMEIRRVDDSHWWVGTEATYDRFPVIVWTDPLGPDRDTFFQRIANALGTSADQIQMAIDPDSNRAILLLPRYIVRQLPKIQNGLNLTQLN